MGVRLMGGALGEKGKQKGVGFICRPTHERKRVEHEIAGVGPGR